MTTRPSVRHAAFWYPAIAAILLLVWTIHAIRGQYANDRLSVFIRPVALHFLFCRSGLLLIGNEYGGRAGIQYEAQLPTARFWDNPAFRQSFAGIGFVTSGFPGAKAVAVQVTHQFMLPVSALLVATAIVILNRHRRANTRTGFEVIASETPQPPE